MPETRAPGLSVCCPAQQQSAASNCCAFGKLGVILRAACSLLAFLSRNRHRAKSVAVRTLRDYLYESPLPRRMAMKFPCTPTPLRRGKIRFLSLHRVGVTKAYKVHWGKKLWQSAFTNILVDLLFC